MNTRTVSEFIRHLEHDLLEAKHLLRSGLSVSLEHLRRSGDATTEAMTRSAKTKLRRLENLSEKVVDEVEKHLMQLNYLAADQEIHSVADFDAFAVPLTASLAVARRALKSIDANGRGALGKDAGPIGKAWRDLHLHMEIVRLLLSLAEMDSKEKALELRQVLSVEFDKAANYAAQELCDHQAESLIDRIFSMEGETFVDFKEGFKTFMMIDEPNVGKPHRFIGDTWN